MSDMLTSAPETDPSFHIIETDAMPPIELERICRERAEGRINRSPEELAHDDAFEKLHSFKLFVSGETACDRSERFVAYYHITDELHELQHAAFLEVFGIEEFTDEEFVSPSREMIVKVDDPENPSVAIKRQLLAYDDGQVYGISYRGVRFGEQPE